MKNFIIILLSTLSFTFAFSQEKVADFGEDTKTYSKNRSNGVYVFHLKANEYTEAQVAKASSYYKNNFLVTTKEEGDRLKVQVSLKGISDQNKKIIQRFFVGLEIKQINYKGETFDNPIEFLQKYI